MDIGVIVYTTELEAPSLRETARRILEAEAARFGVPLGRAEVLHRRAQGGSPMHVMAAADELVRHLGAAPDPLGADSPLMILARAGALALVNRAELYGNPLALLAPPRASVGAGRRVSCPIQDDDGERVRLRFDLDKRTADRPAVCGGFRVPLFPEVGVLLELRRPALGLSRCRQAQSPTPGRSFSGRSSLPPAGQFWFSPPS
jgi:hypothetical protein